MALIRFCRRRLGGPLAVLALAALSGGCEPSATPNAARTAADPAAGKYDPIHERRSDEDDLGWTTYRRYCLGCHGEKGDGKGPAAKFLEPVPRDFTRGLFKFKSTPSGDLPTDDDLVRTITRGLHGTAMPNFKLLSRTEKEALLRTLKSFSNAWTDFPPGVKVTIEANPYDMDPEDDTDVKRAVTAGEEIYHATAQCWVCHPLYVEGARREEIAKKHNRPITRANPDQPVLKPDSWGEVIPPPDFKTMRLKSINDVDDLYRVIAAGVGGTAMPSWAGALKAEELWALTLYVNSLVEAGKQSRRANVAQQNDP